MAILKSLAQTNKRNPRIAKLIENKQKETG